jgi:hypothetical protein
MAFQVMSGVGARAIMCGFDRPDDSRAGGDCHRVMTIGVVDRDTDGLSRSLSIVASAGLVEPSITTPARAEALHVTG